MQYPLKCFALALLLSLFALGCKESFEPPESVFDAERLPELGRFISISYDRPNKEVRGRVVIEWAKIPNRGADIKARVRFYDPNQPSYTTFAPIDGGGNFLVRNPLPFRTYYLGIYFESIDGRRWESLDMDSLYVD